MKIQTELIEKYILLLMEYIHLVNTSEIIKQLDNASTVFQIGINAISHIYKITFLITKNVESAGCYTQKGMYCYLEYIEQMNKTNTLHNLDNLDAILFVYDKTLTDLYAPNGITSDFRSASNASNCSHQQNMFSNILSLNHPQTDNNGWKNVLENVCYITKTILWFDTEKITDIQRIDLTHEQLHKWLTLCLETDDCLRETHTNNDSFKRSRSSIEWLNYISVLQDKCIFTYAEYIDILEAMYKTHKKCLKQKKAPNATVIREKCISIILHFSGKNVSEIIESEFGKSEGWKTISDIVKWLYA